MENVKTLEQYLKEAFVADVDDADQSKNTLDIELPDDQGRKKFQLKDGEAVEIVQNKKGKETEVEIEDPKMKKYATSAIKGIKNIKEQDRAETVFRITGNNSKLINKAENDYDKGGIIRIDDKPEDGEDKTPDKFTLFEVIKQLNLDLYEGKYVQFDKDEITPERLDWFKVQETAIGKGEYFLPVMYTDVYKNELSVDGKGDNSLLTTNGESYQIEVKSSASGLSFNGVIEKGKKIYNNHRRDYFQKNVSNTLAKYLLGRNFDDQDLYLIIFDNTESNVDGFFVFNVGKTYNPKGITKTHKAELDTLSEKLYDIIEFKNDDSMKATTDFVFRYSHQDNKILVKLNSNFLDTGSSRRENFDIDEVLALQAQDLTISQAAVELNARYGSLYNFCIANNIVFKPAKKTQTNFEEIYDQIQQMCEDGCTIPEMVKELNCSDQGLRNYCDRVGLEYSKVSRCKIKYEEVIQYIQDGLTITEIADKIDCSPTSLYNFCSRNKVVFNREKKESSISKETLEDLVNQNKTPKQIASELGISINYVYALAKAYDVKLNLERVPLDPEFKDKVKEILQNNPKLTAIPVYNLLLKDTPDDQKEYVTSLKKKITKHVEKVKDKLKQELTPENSSFHIFTFDEMFND